MAVPRDATDGVSASRWYLDVSAFASQPLSSAARNVVHSFDYELLECCSLGTGVAVDSGYKINENFGLGISATYEPAMGTVTPSAGVDFFEPLPDRADVSAFIYMVLPTTDAAGHQNEVSGLSVGLTPAYRVNNWKVALDLAYSVDIYRQNADDGVSADAAYVDETIAVDASYKLNDAIILTSRVGATRLVNTQDTDHFVTQLAFPGITFKWHEAAFSASLLTTSLAAKAQLPSIPFLELNAGYSVH